MGTLSLKKLELYIWENGRYLISNFRITNHMAGGNTFILVDNIMKDHLLMEFHMEKEDLLDKMVTIMKEI